MSNIRTTPEDLQRLHEKFLIDENILHLQKQKAHIIETAVPKYYIKNSDQIETVYSTDVTELLNKIDVMLYSYIELNYPQLAK